MHADHGRVGRGRRLVLVVRHRRSDALFDENRLHDAAFIRELCEWSCALFRSTFSL